MYADFSASFLFFYLRYIHDPLQLEYVHLMAFVHDVFLFSDSIFSSESSEFLLYLILQPPTLLTEISGLFLVRMCRFLGEWWLGQC
jgi:hypothetical protein